MVLWGRSPRSCIAAHFKGTSAISSLISNILIAKVGKRPFVQVYSVQKLPKSNKPPLVRCDASHNNAQKMDVILEAVEMRQ